MTEENMAVNKQAGTIMSQQEGQQGQQGQQEQQTTARYYRSCHEAAAAAAAAAEARSNSNSNDTKNNTNDKTTTNDNINNINDCSKQHSRSLRLRMHALAARSRPSLAHKLQQMALPLSPLVQLTTGAIHAHFPQTVLHFWLLTDAQLESLACFYHQHRRTRGPWSAHYPCPVSWRSDLPLEEKRRRMGRFIGLRGCNRPGARQTRTSRRIESIGAVVAEAAAAAAAAAASTTATSTAASTTPSPSTTASCPISATSATILSEDEITRQVRLAAAAAAHDHIRQRKLNPW